MIGAATTTAGRAELVRQHGLRRESIRRQARSNTAAFAALYRKITPGPQQLRMAARCDDERLLYQADFWPRDHGKTEMFVASLPLRIICNDPNVRILIVQKTGTEARKAVSTIKTELEDNPALRRDYAAHWRQLVGVPDIVNKAGLVDDKTGAWQAQRIYVKRSRRSKDPTVESVGVGGAITGGHFDYIICDDILDDENVKTEDRREKVIAWFFGTIMQLREPHTKVIVVGTLKTLLRNLYSEIMDSAVWNVMVESAILSHDLDEIEYTPIYEQIDGRQQVVAVECHTPDVVVLWPAAWPIEALLLDMLGSGSGRRIWRREKMNDINALAERIFKRRYFRYYSRQNPPRYRQVLQSWDTAFQATGDPSAMTEWGEAVGGAYLRDVYRARLEWPELSLAVGLFYFCAEVRPSAVLIENKASGQSAIQEWRAGKDREAWLIELRNYCQAPGARRELVTMAQRLLTMPGLPRQLRLPVVSIEVPGTQDKESRFEDASIWWANGQVWHPETEGDPAGLKFAQRIAAFEKELAELAPNDDQADSASQAVQYMLAGAIQYRSGRV